MNRIEAKGSSRAVDSLLNYETVKYFNNEAHEARTACGRLSLPPLACMRRA